jgi:biotin carboxyl carrier protein
MQAPSATANARNRCISINGKNPERNEMSKLEARSEVSGFVWKIEVASGQQVAKGDTLVLIESMKMEIPIIGQRGQHGCHPGNLIGSSLTASGSGLMNRPQP